MKTYESFSQHGEDLAVAEHFAWRQSGFFVEVGALDGVTYSNTFMLERDLDWVGILVEANPDQAERCRQARKSSRVVAKAASSPEVSGMTLMLNVVDGFEALSTFDLTGWSEEIVARGESVGMVSGVHQVDVECVTLDAILEEADAPSSFDFLSIDIEGHEEQALEGFSLGGRWKPSVILIENALTRPNTRIAKQLTRGGYSYRRTIAGINEWWEPRNGGLVWPSRAKHYWDYRGQMFRTTAKSTLRRLNLLGRVQALRRR